VNKTGIFVCIVTKTAFGFITQCKRTWRLCYFAEFFSRCVDAIYTVKPGMYSFCVYHYCRWTNI